MEGFRPVRGHLSLVVFPLHNMCLVCDMTDSRGRSRVDSAQTAYGTNHCPVPLSWSNVLLHSCGDPPWKNPVTGLIQQDVTSPQGVGQLYPLGIYIFILFTLKTHIGNLEFTHVMQDRFDINNLISNICIFNQSINLFQESTSTLCYNFIVYNSNFKINIQSRFRLC